MILVVGYFRVLEAMTRIMVIMAILVVVMMAVVGGLGMRVGMGIEIARRARQEQAARPG